MKYKNIIEEILEVYNVNASEFAEKIDVQRSNISHILSGRNNPSLDFLIKVKEVFPELRWDYLLLGKKPMTSAEELAVNKSKAQDTSYDLPHEIENSPSPLLHSPTLFDAYEKEKANVDKPLNMISKESVQENKKINKIVWFYDDNSFEVFDK